jgi:hypothetical protein
MRRFGWLTAALVLFSATAAWAQDAVAVLTEIQTKRGQVHVRTANDTDWVAPKPLQALRAGDQVRVTGEGRAVLVFTGGRGTQLVTQSNSPFKVDVKGEGAVTDRAKAVLGNVTNFLLGQQREKTYQSLSVRSLPPPTLLTPRETLVFADALPPIEWTGAASGGYTIRLVGPQGSAWQAQQSEARKPLPYTGPPLVPGAKYTMELQWKQPEPKDPAKIAKDVICTPPSDRLVTCTQRKQIEVLGADGARRVREGLAVLTPEAAKGYPPSTLVLMRAGLLFQERLYADARRELNAGILKYPEEATLHMLLGHVYERTDLPGFANNEFDEAEALAAGR